MDCSQVNSLPGYAKDNTIVTLDRKRLAAIEQAFAVGMKLCKEFSGKDLYEAGLKWAVKSGHAKVGSTFAAALANIVKRVKINSETGNYVW